MSLLNSVKIQDQFIDILDVTSDSYGSPCIAFMGGGGKSSLISRMGSEFSHMHPKVALTSLTKSGFHHDEAVCIPRNITDHEINAHFALANPLKILKESDSSGKYTGISVDELKIIHDLSDVCLVECDGARKLSLKAHLEHDPVIPKFVTYIIIVVGADVVYTRPEDGLVHRHKVFCKMWKISPNIKLTPEFISKVLTSERGYWVKIPEGIRMIYFINKADRYPEQAMELADSILNRSNHPVYYGSVQKKFWKRLK